MNDHHVFPPQEKTINRRYNEVVLPKVSQEINSDEKIPAPQ